MYPIAVDYREKVTEPRARRPTRSHQSHTNRVALHYDWPEVGDFSGLTAGALNLEENGSGQGYLIVDFGSGGLWAYVNASAWTALNNQSSGVLQSGNFNGRKSG